MLAHRSEYWGNLIEYSTAAWKKLIWHDCTSIISKVSHLKYKLLQAKVRLILTSNLIDLSQKMTERQNVRHYPTLTKYGRFLVTMHLINTSFNSKQHWFCWLDDQFFTIYLWLCSYFTTHLWLYQTQLPRVERLTPFLGDQGNPTLVGSNPGRVKLMTNIVICRFLARG